MDYTKVGEKIRYIREKELKLCREDFAEEIGISPLTLTRLENSVRKINNIETYEKISNITGYTLTELLCDYDLPNKTYKEKLSALLHTLDTDDLEYLYCCVRNYIKLKNKKGKNKQ